TGCESCTNTGYKGRRGLFELLVVTEEIESQIVARKSATEIREVALKQGMKRLREDGWAKVFKGITSVEEVMRVTEENG
ncbi:MAG: type II secretion system protein GspE, partial [Kiritimatiellae bacterium]|nr:type II secretion system protein GspE [Kiritimatiellia bacterium]